MIIAVLLALLSGALLAALVCKGIRLKLWLDVAAGAGAIAATWGSAVIAGSSAWPLAGVAAGYVAVVVWLRRRKASNA